MEELRHQLIKEYCDGMSIPRIITKYNLFRESEFDGKMKRMTKKEVEQKYNIDFHMERSKSINRWLMKSFPNSVGAERALTTGIY